MEYDNTPWYESRKIPAWRRYLYQDIHTLAERIDQQSAREVRDLYIRTFKEYKGTFKFPSLSELMYFWDGFSKISEKFDVGLRRKSLERLMKEDGDRALGSILFLMGFMNSGAAKHNISASHQLDGILNFEHSGQCHNHP